MKKVLALGFAIIFLLILLALLTGCNNAQRYADSAREAASYLEQQYEDTKREYDSLQKDIDDYKQAMSRIDSAY